MQSSNCTFVFCCWGFSPRSFCCLTSVLLDSKIITEICLQDVPDPEIMVAFPIIGDPDKAAFVAWTTTPWTLPSNLALCVNANFQYVKVSFFWLTSFLHLFEMLENYVRFQVKHECYHSCSKHECPILVIRLEDFMNAYGFICLDVLWCPDTL